MAVIDESIQFGHPDLAGQIWTNPYDPVDGLDNDGDGYVDDIPFTVGTSTVTTIQCMMDGTTRGSSDDHGTHVSGTIGAKANNGQGVAGMNWNVTIISCKFLGKRGGTTASYPLNLPQSNVTAVAASTSAGATSSFSKYGATTVDLRAPGSGIWSSTAYNISESYSRTAMATPHVTGAAA